MDRSLRALNVGSTTLKAAIYDLDATHTLVVYARAEIKRETPSEDSLAALLEALPPPRRVPALVIHRIVHGGEDHSAARGHSASKVVSPQRPCGGRGAKQKPRCCSPPITSSSTSA